MRENRTDQVTAEVDIDLDDYADDVYEAFAGGMAYDAATDEELEDYKIIGVEIDGFDPVNDILTLRCTVDATVSYKVPDPQPLYRVVGSEQVDGDRVEGLAKALKDFTDIPPFVAEELATTLIKGLAKQSPDS